MIEVGDLFNVRGEWFEVSAVRADRIVAVPAAEPALQTGVGAAPPNPVGPGTPSAQYGRYTPDPEGQGLPWDEPVDPTLAKE